MVSTLDAGTIRNQQQNDVQQISDFLGKETDLAPRGLAPKKTSNFNDNPSDYTVPKERMELKRRRFRQGEAIRMITRLGRFGRPWCAPIILLRAAPLEWFEFICMVRLKLVSMCFAFIFPNIVLFCVCVGFRNKFAATFS